MTRRAPAARGRADAKQAECIRAIKLLKLPFRVIKTGDGVGDLLILMPCRRDPTRDDDEPLCYWLECEVKCIERESTGYVRYTPAQKKWRAETPGAPRITVTGFADCLERLRALMG